MKTFIFLSTIILTVSLAYAAKGYVKKSGKYVAPYQKTRANSTQYDNYSSKGNINPYTGKKGYVNPKK